MQKILKYLALRPFKPSNLPTRFHEDPKILQRKRVPSYTITGDGLPGDPVNVALVGTVQQLRSAFANLGWSEADRLGLASSWDMIRAFVFNSPYPTAPFSTLYLFGRGQDIGFQKAIDDSPRKRHHIRFWALSVMRAQSTWGAAGLWMMPNNHLLTNGCYGLELARETPAYP